MSAINTGAKGAERSGGQLLVECLLEQGAEHLFCVPGESYLAVLDALYDAPQIAVTTCRQEGGAAMMAEAHGKLTGRPGVCMVTRAPGASNASAGLHVAFQDSTPMLLLIGQVARDQLEREAFQEIDYRRFFGQLAKWVAQIDDPARIPEFIARAYRTAMSGRPGPVVLALPEDMLRETTAGVALPRVEAVFSRAGEDELAELTTRLTNAERPLALVGGAGWNAAGCAALQQFAERWDIPVAASFRCQDHFDNRHRNYVGDVGIAVNPQLAQRLRDADLLLVLGPRLGEMTTGGYTLLDPAQPQPALIHVHAGAEELGRVYQPSLAICAQPAAFAITLAELPAPTEFAPGRVAWRATARADYLRWSEPAAGEGGEMATAAREPRMGGEMGSGVDLAQVIAWLREQLPEDAILCNGAGNYASWLHRYFRYRGWRSQLAPTSGSMGYGVPAAIAAKRIHPERTVLALAGDGCFLMHGQELASAVLHRLGVIFIVVNNGMYGTIRMHQQRNYPDRVIATELANPDFSAMAKAYGAFGEVVSSSGEFAAAFGRALASSRSHKLPALLELRTDVQQITPAQRLDDL